MKITRDQLVPLIAAYRRTSLGAEDSDLSNERATALDHYHGRPYGDEQEGRSQVTSRDLSETIDWIMPGIMDTMLQSGNLAEFDPVSEDDEDKAQQESDMINHAIMKDNQGFIVIHDAVHDALLLKNGYFKHWWDESEIIRTSEYEGLTQDGLAKLFTDLGVIGFEDIETYEFELKNGGKLEVIGYEETQTDKGAIYDLEIRTTRKVNRLKVEALPPEEVRVSKSCRGSLQDSPFVEHVTKKTRSELIEMGMPVDFVKELPAVSGEENDQEQDARDSVNDENDVIETISIDQSMHEIQYCEAYIKVDYDGDGIAELRRIVTVADRIPPGDEWIEPVDSVAITQIIGKRMPHRHVGRSLDDELEDLQRIKTVLWRQLLDNIYGSNNQETVINERAHIPDFLQRLPNGIKRVIGEDPVQNAVMPYPTTPIINQILPAIDYMDRIKDNRTGINETTTNGDPDVLKAATKGAYLESIKQASQKVRMITRMLAETGIKELVLRCHELMIKHQDVPRTVKLRGKFVEINPTEWQERTDLTVKVGLGTGTNEEKRQNLLLLSSLMEKLAPYGMIGPQQAYNAFQDIARTMGIVNPDQYVMDPDSPEFQQAMAQAQQQQNQNPLAEAEAVKGQFQAQIEQMKTQHKYQMDLLKMQSENQLNLWKLQTEQDKRDRELQSKEAIEVMKAELQAFLAGQKLDLGQPGIGAEIGNA